MAESFKISMCYILICVLLSVLVSAEDNSQGYEDVYDDDVISVSVERCTFPAANHTAADLQALHLITETLVGKSYSFIDETTSDKWTYSIGICVFPEKTEFDPNTKELAGAGALQYHHKQDQDDKDVLEVYVIGRMNDTEIMIGTNLIVLQYNSGDAHRFHCNMQPRSTLVTIACDPDEYEGRLSLTATPPRAPPLPHGQCAPEYTFRLQHRVACTGTQESGAVTRMWNAQLWLVFSLVSIATIIVMMCAHFHRLLKGVEGGAVGSWITVHGK